MKVDMDHESFQHVLQLLQCIQEKDSELTILKSQVNSLSAMLNLAIKQPPRYVNKKYAFYRNHKNDPIVLERIRQEFPNLKKPPKDNGRFD